MGSIKECGVHQQNIHDIMKSNNPARRSGVMDRTDGCYIATIGTLYSMSGKEIADHLRESQGNPSESEYRSWENSIPILVKVLHQAGLDALTLALEYQTPIGSRIDAVLLGERRETRKPLVLIFELKQWSSIGENVRNTSSNVSVLLSKIEGRYEDRPHPILQTQTYAKHLQMNHSGVCDGQMEVERRQFLHNFEEKERLFQGAYSVYSKYRCETYGKGEEDKLAEDLRGLFSPSPRPDVVSYFLSGVYTLGEASFRDLKLALDAEENAVMLDDQREVNIQLWSKITALFRPDVGKHLFIISGPPGTGKTVVGLHAIYAYCLKDRRSGQNRRRCVFALPRSRTLSQVIAGASGVAPAYLDAIPPERDLVVVDEAHRIEHLDDTLSKLFRKANLIVVLQDDRQRIRPTEEGTAEHFRRFAEHHRIPHTICSLASQKRAGYLGSYVSDLDKLLYDRWKHPLQRQSALELRCWDDLNALDRHLYDLFSNGRHVKWYAPFCWSWSRSVKNKDIVIPQSTGVFQKAWNPPGAQYDWYLSQAPEDLEQVGCIYTAQGLEYDDIGIIWWDDLCWDETARDWRIDLEKSKDDSFRIPLQKSPPEVAVELMLNTYRVLLTRAKSSVHIWFRDPVTRDHVRKILDF